MEKLLIRGNIVKLITLYRYGAVTREQLLPILQIDGLLFRVLDQLYEKVFLLCATATRKRGLYHGVSRDSTELSEHLQVLF